jgi:chondroitin AC lyase
MTQFKNILIFLFVILPVFVSAQTNDIELVKAKLREITLHYTDQTAVVNAEKLELQLADGKFSDLNYADNSAAKWQWGVHWQRLTTLAKAFKLPESTLYLSETLKFELIAGVDYWLANHTKPKNAWWELIGVPFEMGKVFILMQDEMGTERLQKILPQMNLAVRPDMYYYWGPATGQNLLWEAFNHVYASALVGDDAGLKRAFAAASNEIIITKSEGIQPDFSFYQHGAQSYAFGYGKAFSLSAAQILYVAHGTKYALPDEKTNLISAYLLDGQRWCSYLNMLEYTAMGREISRPDSKTKTIAMAAGLMSKIDGQRSHELSDLVSQLTKSPEGGYRGLNVLKGNRYFPRIDFMVQQGGRFMMTVKAVSKDIVSTETGNLENLKGYHLGRGTQFIVRRGDEYEGIFPLWDWEKIPGSLCEQTGKPLPVYDWTKGAQGNTDFVLGVSNGKTGCFTYDYNKDSIKAHRSWFFFENEMAMLVSGLQFERPNSVFQTINQTYATGDVFVNAKKLDNVEIISKKVKSVWHDSIAYLFFADKFPVSVNTTIHSGAWSDINRAESDKIIEKKLFTLGIDAGKSAKNGAFACIVIPNADVKSKSQLRILRNTSVQQVVYNKTSQTLQFVAYAPCEILLPWSNMTLSLGKAGIGVIQQNGNMLEFKYIASKGKDNSVKIPIGQGQVFLFSYKSEK